MMDFRTKLLFLTLLPVIGITIAGLILIDFQSERLARDQGLAVEKMIRTSKQAELQNYLKLVRTAIAPFYQWNDVSILQAQSQVANVVTQMTYGDDGYFFIAKSDGTRLENPILFERIGLEKLNDQAQERKLVISNATKVDANNDNSGLYQYSWNKPSTGLKAEKLGHSVSLEKWDWVIGSGLYVDDIAAQIGEIQGQLQDNVKETRKVLLALAIGVVLLTSLLFAYLRLSEQRFADKKLKELASEIVDAQENERKRVSTELHDGISQLLVSARYGLDIASANAKDNTDISIPIEKAGATISTAIAEIRRISMALRPSILDDMGLASALNSLAKDFEDQTTIRTVVSTQNVGPLLDDRQKTCLYRVAQEALANIAKHSRANQVHLTLKCKRNKVFLDIEDNGRGLDIRKNKNKYEGHGLRNMQERVESHNGTFSVSSKINDGLKLSAVLAGSNNIQTESSIADKAA